MLVVSNHLSNIDPWIFGGFGPGVLYCMSKRELFNNPIVAWILAGCNCFPIDRGTADRRAAAHRARRAVPPRQAADLPRRHPLVDPRDATGRGWGRFPRAPLGCLNPAHRHLGTEAALPRGRKFPKRVPIRLKIGPVFQLPEREPGERRDDQAVADLIGSRIAELLPPTYRGVYASVGEPEAAPRVG